MNTQLVESLVQVIRSLSAEEQSLLQEKLLTEFSSSRDRATETEAIAIADPQAWATLTADQFLSGYSPIDAIYDEP